jgi:outer membrane protein
MISSFRTVAAAALLSATAFTPALAQNLLFGPTGYSAGDILAHLSVIAIVPENLNSHVNGPIVGGDHVGTSIAESPELDASYFLTPNVSLELIAATTKHDVWATGNSAGKVKVGSTWVLPPTLTAQYHFAQLGPVRPYVGLGLTVAFFYSPSRSATLTSLNAKLGGLSTGVGPAIDAGFDVPLGNNFTANVDVKQIFLTTSTRIAGGAIGAVTELDPTVVGVGVGYQF